MGDEYQIELLYEGILKLTDDARRVLEILKLRLKPILLNNGLYINPLDIFESKRYKFINLNTIKLSTENVDGVDIDIHLTVYYDESPEIQNRNRFKMGAFSPSSKIITLSVFSILKEKWHDNHQRGIIPRLSEIYKDNDYKEFIADRFDVIPENILSHELIHVCDKSISKFNDLINLGINWEQDYDGSYYKQNAKVTGKVPFEFNTHFSDMIKDIPSRLSEKDIGEFRTFLENPVIISNTQNNIPTCLLKHGYFIQSCLSEPTIKKLFLQKLGSYYISLN